MGTRRRRQRQEELVSQGSGGSSGPSFLPAAKQGACLSRVIANASAVHSAVPSYAGPPSFCADHTLLWGIRPVFDFVIARCSFEQNLRSRTG